MEEKSQNSAFAKKPSTRKAQNSVVSKYINAAVERQQRTSTLAKPVLKQKRNQSISSHQSLRISTQPSECLSNRSRRIAPSTTSTIVNQVS